MYKGYIEKDILPSVIAKLPDFQLAGTQIYHEKLLQPKVRESTRKSPRYINSNQAKII